MGEEHKNLKKVPGLGALELCSSLAERVYDLRHLVGGDRAHVYALAHLQRG